MALFLLAVQPSRKDNNSGDPAAQRAGKNYEDGNHGVLWP